MKCNKLYVKLINFVLCFMIVVAITSCEDNSTTSVQKSDDVKKETKKAISPYERCKTEFNKILSEAKSGDPLIQDAVGACYRNGNGVKKDDIQAVYWFNEAYKNGNIQAGVNLGKMYLSGNGVQQNAATAVDLFKKAANKGDWYGKYHLALTLEYGSLEEASIENIQKAVALYNDVINDKNANDWAIKESQVAVTYRVDVMNFLIEFWDKVQKINGHASVMKSVDISMVKKEMAQIDVSRLSNDLKMIYHDFVGAFVKYNDAVNEYRGANLLVNSFTFNPKHYLNLAKDFAGEYIGEKSDAKMAQEALDVEFGKLIKQLKNENISIKFYYYMRNLKYNQYNKK